MGETRSKNETGCGKGSSPVRVLGIEFAPTNVSWTRRKQVLSVFVVFLVFIAFPMITAFFGIFIVGLLQFTSFGPISLAIVIPYLTWMVLDRNTCLRGGRSSKFVRSWRIWRWFNEYFPIKLVKTVDLDPKRNYLFCGHPHGLMCSGIFGCFGTEGNTAKETFPGFKFSILTFTASFWTMAREFILWLGVCSAARESMNYILSQKGGGNIAILIPGGAPEALDFCPGSYVLQLNERKGFVKVALQNGSPLVPVFVFGEHELVNQVPNPRGSFLRKFQDLFQKIFFLPPVLFYGRGLFQYTLGFLPIRKPLTVVVGEPIPLEKVSQPTNDQINDLHLKYVDSLTKLFNHHKAKYSPNDTLVIT